MAMTRVAVALIAGGAGLALSGPGRHAALPTSLVAAALAQSGHDTSDTGATTPQAGPEASTPKVGTPAGGSKTPGSETSGAASAADYPASARDDYILACVNVNGGTEQARKSCSCSMDVIASILPYDRYDQADTILRMRRMSGGYLASEFRVQSTNQTLDELREAQAEGEVRCF